MKFLFAWRWQLVSNTGPPSSTTRHVLLTLALHMDQAGASAYPSIRKLASETGLTERTVGEHLIKAERSGWITRKRWRDRGKNWAQLAYHARLPERGSAPERKGNELGAQGSAPPAVLVPNDVPTNSSDNSSITANRAGQEGFQRFRLGCELLGLRKRR